MIKNTDFVVRALLILGTGIIAVAGTAAVHAAYEYLSHKVRKRTHLGWSFVMFTLAVNAFILSLLLLKVEDLHKGQRIEARFYPAKEAYGEMRNVIQEAKDGSTIYALNSFEVPFRGLSGDPEEVAKAEQSREKYFQVIEDKMRRVNYHRVIQVRDMEGADIPALTGPRYIEHFQKMVALQDHIERDTVTSLQLAPSQYSMSFLIVENPGGRSFLTWQVDQRLITDSGYKAGGYLIVSDPDQVIIRHFKVLFNQVALEKRARRVRSDDLAPRWRN